MDKQTIQGCWLLQVLFNIIYDVLLASKLTWHALCPVVDSMNHSSASQVSNTSRKV